MSDYTIVNLREVEDMAPKFGFAPNLESRFARKQLQLENSGLSYFKVAPEFRMPFGHVHSEQEEIYLVVSGNARLRLDDEVLELKAWDAVRIPPGVMRGLAGGPDGCEVVAIGAPNNDNQDVEMVQGWWTD
jgi:mannose-6-phosphate isomerase-like protein (cupin superfamily)